ncbi:MAG: hypothetical protein E5X48_23690 [Mesorhizobium sp.]|uniref:hypothetical protein n=1 Tax=Mesorhizobium sp. TaxID=1871066 RepID=UPI0011FF47C0|nr:hypothetical protein [Mesorhizobium sp.]TIQ33342.1 MAG: hypothetical protein E5X48_23690 [Mesorhizobium sp.]
MAKQPATKNGTSRIRFIMLDAEIPEGDLSQITLAIQNALKPTTTIVQRRLPAQTAAALQNGVQEEEMESEDELVDTAGEALTEPVEVRPQRETRTRKPTVPKVLELDLSSGASFEAFAGKHAPKNDIERNLVVLAWFKEHRPDEEVTANHVYTCYRAVKWPSGIDDFSWPLRALKKEQLVMSPHRGQYVINHLGIARVEKMGAGS